MPKFKRSPCPVANLLDVLGDKWTLLVVRDLLTGAKTYKEIQHSPERIPTNILAERLKRLQREEIIGRIQYQEKPVRYTYMLTDKGMDLRPVISAMAKWGNKYVPGTVIPENIDAIAKNQKN